MQLFFKLTYYLCSFAIYKKIIQKYKECIFIYFESKLFYLLEMCKNICDTGSLHAINSYFVILNNMCSFNTTTFQMH